MRRVEGVVAVPSLGEMLLYMLAMPKSLFFNLRYFRFSEAIRLPVLVSHRVALAKLSGSIVIEQQPRFGLVKIGFGEIDLFDRRRSRTIWSLSGRITFRGKANIGHGSKIVVKPKGHLILGEDFVITAESQLYCWHQIEFGRMTLMSWETLVMDADGHAIHDATGEIINEPRPITVGDRVWVGCRCTILKGTSLGSDVVVAANTCLTGGSAYGDRVIVGGNPPRVIKEGVTWQR